MRVKQCKRNEGHGDYRNLTWRAFSQSMLPLLQVSCLILLKKIPTQFPGSPLSTSLAHLFSFSFTYHKNPALTLYIFFLEKSHSAVAPLFFFSSYHPKPAPSKHPAPSLVISPSSLPLKLPFSRCSRSRPFLPNPKTLDQFSFQVVLSGRHNQLIQSHLMVAQSNPLPRWSEEEERKKPFFLSPWESTLAKLYEDV